MNREEQIVALEQWSAVHADCPHCSDDYVGVAETLHTLREALGDNSFCFVGAATERRDS